MKKTELEKIFIKHSSVKASSQNLNDTFMNLEQFTAALIEMHENYAFDFIEEVVPKKKIPPKENRLRVEQRNEKKKTEFINALQKEYINNPNWNTDIVKRFWQYWTEWDTLNPKKGLRFEKHEQFNIKRRMNTFIQNQKRFDKNNGGDKL